MGMQSSAILLMFRFLDDDNLDPGKLSTHSFFHISSSPFSLSLSLSLSLFLSLPLLFLFVNFNTVLALHAIVSFTIVGMCGWWLFGSLIYEEFFEQVEWLFKCADTSGSGTISGATLMQVIDAVKRKPNSAVQVRTETSIITVEVQILPKFVIPSFSDSLWWRASEMFAWGRCRPRKAFRKAAMFSGIRPCNVQSKFITVYTWKVKESQRLTQFYWILLFRSVFLKILVLRYIVLTQKRKGPTHQQPPEEAQHLQAANQSTAHDWCYFFMLPIRYRRGYSSLSDS